MPPKYKNNNNCRNFWTTKSFFFLCLFLRKNIHKYYEFIYKELYSIFFMKLMMRQKIVQCKKKRVLQQQMMIMFLQAGRQLRHWQLDDHLKMLQVWSGGYFWSGQYEWVKQSVTQLCTVVWLVTPDGRTDGLTNGNLSGWTAGPNHAWSSTFRDDTTHMGLLMVFCWTIHQFQVSISLA